MLGARLLTIAIHVMHLTVEILWLWDCMGGPRLSSFPVRVDGLPFLRDLGELEGSIHSFHYHCYRDEISNFPGFCNDLNLNSWHNDEI